MKHNAVLNSVRSISTHWLRNPSHSESSSTFESLLGLSFTLEPLAGEEDHCVLFVDATGAILAVSILTLGRCCRLGEGGSKGREYRDVALFNVSVALGIEDKSG